MSKWTIVLRRPRTNERVALGIAAISVSVLLVPVLAAAGSRPSSGKAAPSASAPLGWTLTRVSVNPNNEPNPSGSSVTARTGHLDWQVLVSPQAAFSADYPTPPTALAPGRRYEFPVTLAGRITGGADTPGYRQFDVILYLYDRWVDPVSGPSPSLKQSCGAPSYGAPVSCTPAGSLKGKLGFVVPTPQKPGDAFSFGVGALNCSRCYVRFEYQATGRSAQGLKKLDATRELRIFYGLDDPVAESARAWEARKHDYAFDVERAALRFPRVTIEADIDGEESGGKHSPALLVPGNDLYVLLALDTPPLELFSDGNVYARATPVFEQELRRKILASSGKLEPAEVLHFALQVTRGSYALAVLTAHNLLKNATKIGRAAIMDAQRAPLPVTDSAEAIALYNRRQQDELARLRKWTPIVAKLASLRADPPGRKDKLGPWYHAFAILTAGALVDGETAQRIVLAEHTGKRLNIFTKEGGFDREKFELDSVFAAAAQVIDARGLHRPRVRP